MTVEARTRSLDRRYFGVVIAIVSANEDPDELGRIKLNFPWFDGGQTESDWCRVAQPYAGGSDDKRYGAVFIPEVGDEVLVAFEQGDMRFPYVLGGLYNGTDKPPVARTSDRDTKAFITKAGHELVLDDTSSSRVVRLKTAGGHVLELDDQNQKVHVTTSGGREVVLDDGGAKITVTTGQGTEITLDGSSVVVKGTTIKLQGTSIELGDGASEPVILGQQFYTAIATHTHNVTMIGAPSGPPVPPIPPTVLSQTVKTK